jgi:CDGSH-type Zn-finger protein
MSNVTIEVLENGPYIIVGPVDVIDYDGRQVPVLVGRKSIALCRCGGSSQKPFCDGTHSKLGFRGAHVVVDKE